MERDSESADILNGPVFAPMPLLITLLKGGVRRRREPGNPPLQKKIDNLEKPPSKVDKNKKKKRFQSRSTSKKDYQRYSQFFFFFKFYVYFLYITLSLNEL